MPYMNLLSCVYAQSMNRESISYVNERSGTFADAHQLRTNQAEAAMYPVLRAGDIVIVRAGEEPTVSGRIFFQSPFWMGRIEVDKEARTGESANHLPCSMFVKVAVHTSAIYSDL
eukprot:3337976-Pleurochrysis_carterae.AAC.1